MSLTNSGERQLIVTIIDQYMTMVVEDSVDGEMENVGIDPHTWATIMPRALAESTDRFREFSMIDLGPKGSDALEFDVDDHLMSLFNLAIIVECCDSLSIIGKIADCWMCYPREVRSGWRHQASSDKPIHAQLMPASHPASSVFCTAVPAWLPKLIDVGNFRRGAIAETGLHWAYSRSTLGTSCIAFLDDEGDSHEACLALSDCPVSCGTADGSMRQPALEAIDLLIAYYDAILVDRTLPGEVGWHPNAHDLLDISATLDEWRTRIEQMPRQLAATLR